MTPSDPGEDPARPSGPLAPAHFAFTAKIGQAAQTSRSVRALLAFLSSALSIGLMTAVALVTAQPLVFPSLGPTAYVLFDRPHSAAAAPRTVFLGHLVGVGAGYASLVAFGLRHTASTLHGGLVPSRIGATALSLGLTAAGMVLFRCWHAPAGATTLIVSLGLLTRPEQLGTLMGAVVLLIAQGVVFDKLGLALPTWKPSSKRQESKQRNSQGGAMGPAAHRTPPEQPGSGP